MSNFRLSVFVLSIALCCSVSNKLAAEEVLSETLRTEYQPIQIEKISDGLEHPWSIAFLPDSDMLVTERAGALYRINADGERSVISGTPDAHVQSQGGLLEVLPHPEFTDNRLIYFTYSKANGEDTATALARGRLEDDQIVDLEDVFIQDRYSAPGRHYGSKLAWLPDGTLLMSIGDRGAEPPRAQDLDDHAGSLLRLNDDGSIPDDNPFVGRDDAKPEIWSYGHRNIQGLMAHPETGEIWATEHGPRGGDELNLIERGGNYGWPVVSRGRDYRTEEQFSDGARSHPDMIDPVIDWTPSLAASGLAVLVDDHFEAWQGNFLAGGLRAEQIRRVVFEHDEVVHEEELLRGHIGRIRDVRVGPDSNVYVITDHPEGALYRISPANR
ncbi:MAG: PQQ-dependent sugar dehydrogenase [Wenzhouxiangella sp.]